MDAIIRTAFALGIHALAVCTFIVTSLVRILTPLVRTTDARESRDKGAPRATPVESFESDIASTDENHRHADALERIRRATSDHDKRIEKYRAYLSWREEYCMDSTLTTAKPYYEAVKKMYPHAFHKRSKGRHGSCVIQMEKAGQFGTLLKGVRARGEEIGRWEDDPIQVVTEHVSFVMTYLFEALDTRRWPLGKTIRIVDMSRLGMDDIGLNVFGFLRVMSETSRRAFVERIQKIYIVHPPTSFAVIYNACKSMISDKTRKQIIVCETLDQFIANISKEVELEDIPREYGGKCACVDCWRDDENERKILALVASLNAVREHEM